MLKKIKKIIRESAFDKKKKKPGLKFNPRLALTGVRTNGPWTIKGFHLRGQHLCKFIGTEEIVYIRKEFNSHRTGLVHKHGRRDVMWSYVIGALQTQLAVGGF